MLFELRRWGFLESVGSNIDFCILLLIHLLSEFLVAETIKVCILLSISPDLACKNRQIFRLLLCAAKKYFSAVQSNRRKIRLFSQATPDQWPSNEKEFNANLHRLESDLKFWNFWSVGEHGMFFFQFFSTGTDFFLPETFPRISGSFKNPVNGAVHVHGSWSKEAATLELMSISQLLSYMYE